MRENKFRVYCEIEFNGELHKSMESATSWFLMTQTGKLWTYDPGEIPRPLEKEYKKAIPLFYTGVKDKNGKEIYEGDVITGPDCSYPGKVVYSDAEFLIKWEEESDFLSNNYMDYEVIGNIYENPELLKEAK